MKKSRRRKADPSSNTLPSDGANFIKTLHIALRIAQAIFFFLFFLAVIVSPLYESTIWGITVRGVVRSILLLLASSYCWLRSTQPSPPQPGLCVSKSGFWESCWPQFIFLCVFLIFIEWFILTMRSPYQGGPVLGNDPPQYYAYLHSWVFDRDMRFENEYQMIPGVAKFMAEHYPQYPGWNVAPIGTAILWMPFYLLAHVGVCVLRSSGAKLVADGISSPYAAGAAFGSIFLVWTGMLMVYATIGRRFSKRTAFFTTLLIWLATPIISYVTAEPWMSHACSFFAGALVFFMWQKQHEHRSTGAWVSLGAGIGLAMLVRPDQFVLLLLPVLEMILQPFESEKKDIPVRQTCLCLASALAVFSPQLITWWVRSGLRSPQGAMLQWSNPAMMSVLFSARSGLFAWHPVTLLGFIGVPLLWKRSRSFALMVGIILLADTYVNASFQGWWGGSSFGMRRFVGMLPFVAPGLAAFGSWAVALWRKRPAIPATLLVLLLALYNALLLVQYRDQWFQPGYPLSFMNTFGSTATLFHSYFGNPFSYPANLYFAAKYGVSPAQYDVVGGAAPTDKHELDLKDAQLRPYLGKGWEIHYKTSFFVQPFAAKERYCSLLLPLKKGEAYRVELVLSPTPGLEKGQSVSLALNGHDLGKTELNAQDQTNVAAYIKETITRDGVNVLDLTFGRIQAQSSRIAMGLEVKTGYPIERAALLHRLKVYPVPKNGIGETSEPH